MKTFNKIMAIILSAAFILPLALFPTGATGGDLIFDSATVAAATSVFGGKISYNSNENALRADSAGSAVGATFALSGVPSGTKYAVVTCKNQLTNSDIACRGKLEIISGGEVTEERHVDYTKGYKAYSTVVPLDTANEADGLKISFLSEASNGDMVYFYSITFHQTRQEAEAAAKTDADRANGEILSKYTEEELTLNVYEQERYMIPYWNTDIIYNEAIYPLLNKDGTIDDITLMYDASKIVSVRSSTLKIEYKEGVDYELVGGKLRILTSGSIPCVAYNRHYFTTQPSDIMTYKMIKGGYVRFQEGNVILADQLAITYVHEDEWAGFLPPNQGEELSRTKGILESGGNLNIVFFGDSITNGGNSSSVVNIAPHAEKWTTMLETELKKLYPNANITCKNTSISGGSVGDAKKNVYTAITPYNPDLLILALGTNDAQYKYSYDKVITDEMTYVINAVKQRCPNCEIILVAPMFSNPECFSKDYFYQYRNGYYGFAEADGIVVADVMAVHDYLLTRKSYTDMSANNICHLNDFLARTYSQTVLKTITADNASASFKTTVINRINSIANLDLYDQVNKERITALIAEATAKVNSASKTEDALRIYRDTKTAVNSVPVKSNEVSIPVNYTNILFNSEEKVDLLNLRYHIGASYSAKENAALINVTMNSDPRTNIVFPTNNPVYATDYKYAVITYKAPSSNSSAAKQMQVFPCAGLTDSPLEEQSKLIDLEVGDQYHSAVVDLSGDSWWNGTVNKIRIDPFVNASKGDKMYLSSFILCKNAEDAERIANKRAAIANGTYVSASVKTLFDTEDTTSLFTAEEKFIYGDASGDGKLTSKDVTAISFVLSGYVEETDVKSADANADGKLNARDLTHLRQIMAGFATETVGIRASRPDNVTYSASSGAITVSPADKFIHIKADAPLADANFAVLVYKAAKSSVSTAEAIIKGNDGETTYRVAISNDGDYSALIIEYPKEGNYDGFLLNTNGLTLEIDSIGLFETADMADSFAYERLWERKSDKVYDFNIKIPFTSDILSKFSYTNNANISAANGSLCFKVTSGKTDPYAYLDLRDFGISADEYKYIIYEYMLPTSNSSAANLAEIFFCAGSTTVPTAGISTRFNLIEDGSYHKQLINMTPADYWKGDLYGIRLDFFANANSGDTCYIKQITFCRNESEALEFMNK